MEKNELSLQLFNHLQCTLSDEGVPEVQGFEVVKESLEAFLSINEGIVVEHSELGVQTAKQHIAKLTKGEKAIKELFDNQLEILQEQMNYFTSKRRVLQKLLSTAKEEQKQQALKIMEDWKKDILLDIERDFDCELSIDDFSDVKVDMRTSKKGLTDKMVSKAEELQEAYLEKNKNVEALVMFATSQGIEQDIIELFTEKLNYQPLSQVMSDLTNWKLEHSDKKEPEVIEKKESENEFKLPWEEDEIKRIYDLQIQGTKEQVKQLAQFMKVQGILFSWKK